MTNSKFILYTLVVMAIGATLGAGAMYLLKPAQVKVLETCTYQDDKELLTTIKAVVKSQEKPDKATTVKQHGS